MKKKKVNSKASYKKGGEKWVSEKMANLPMYQVAGMVTNPFGFPTKILNDSYGKMVSSVSPGGMNPFANISNNNYAPAASEEWTQATATQPEVKKTQLGTPSKNTTINTNPSVVAEDTTQPAPPTTTIGTASTSVDNSNYLRGDYNLNNEANTLDNKDKFGNPTGGTAKDFEYLQKDYNLSGGVDEADKIDKDGNPIVGNTQNAVRSQQFYNPYGGFDLASSAGMLGQSIKEKNTLGIVGSGAKLALGLGRNIVGGMGLANRENFIKSEFDDQIRDSIRGTNTAMGNGGYFQTGGEKIKNPDGSYSMRTTETTSTPGTAGYTIRGNQGSPAVLATQGVNSTDMGRNRAFAQARSNGQETFMYNGKSYTTEMSGTKGRAAVIPTPDISMPGTPATSNTVVEDSPLYSNVYDVQAERGYIGGRRGDGVLGGVATGQQYTSNKEVGERTMRAASNTNQYVNKIYGEEARALNPRDLNPAQLALRNSKMAQREEDLYQTASVNTMAVPMGLERENVGEFRDGTNQFGDQQIAAQYRQGGEMIKRADGSYSKRGMWDNIRDNKGSGKKPTKEMLAQGRKINSRYQEGGEQQMEPQQAPQEEQIMQQVAQALQQGADPQQVVQQLVQSGVPEEQAVQMIQMVMQQLQGGQQEQPQMQRGGEYNWGQQPKNVYEELKPEQMRGLRVDGGNTGISVPAKFLDETGNILAGQEANVQRYVREASSRSSSKSYPTYQDGGQPQEQAQPGPEEIIQAYAQASQQDPEEIMQQLQQMQPEEQQQALQQMMEALQGGQQEQQVMRKGGEIAKKLTGEYTLEEEENPNVNSEIENNEFVQTPDGEVTVAKGATHEKGGIEVELEGGTKIISDHLKLGSINSKHYKENFDLDVKASSTYAKVLANFTKKSGLQKIVDEQERIIEQLKKLEEQAQGQDSAIEDSTMRLNKQFLGKKISDLEEEKKPLEEARKQLLEDVFARQEDSKPASERSGNNEFQNGGYMDLVTKYNISPERATELMQEYKAGGKLPKYQGGLAPYELKAGEGFSDNEQINFYRQATGLGYTGKNNQGDIQRFMNKARPEEVVNYFTKSGQPLTAKHVDLVKRDYPDIFKKTGVDPNKPSAAYTPEEKLKLQNIIDEVDTTETKSVYNNFLLEGFADNKWDWRAPVVGLKPLAAAGFSKAQAPKMTTGKIFTPYQAQQEVYTSPEEKAKKSRGEGAKFMSLPDQSPMMPDSLTGALKLTRRYDRMDPMQVSATEQISDLRGQATQAGQQLQQMAGSEAAAGMANVSAVTQQNIAKAYANTNKANMGSDAQAQQFNAQTQRMEEDARGTDVNAYERKIYQAMATTDANTRNYYNQLKAVDLANYNAVNNVNSMNQMYDNYKYDGTQVAQTDDQINLNYSSMKARQADEAKNTPKKKKSVARFGGKKK
jgi:hypothetical protein